MQAGFDAREIEITEDILDRLKIQDQAGNTIGSTTYTTGITVDAEANKLVYNELVPRQQDGVVNNELYFVVDGVDVKWNEDENRIEVDAVEIKGGNITIAGQLFNTGEGNLNVMSGYGKVAINNQTDAEIYIGDITNDYVSGTVTLIDTSQSIGSATQFKKTEYYRELNQDNQVQLVKNVYTRSGAVGDFDKLDAESFVYTDNTRQGIFTPRENLIYTYKNFNLSAEDNNLLQQYTTLNIGGEQISVVYDFIPVLSVNADVYDSIGVNSEEGKFNIGAESTYGSINLTSGNGDESPRVRQVDKKDFYEIVTEQEQVDTFLYTSAWYDTKVSGPVRISDNRSRDIDMTIPIDAFGNTATNYEKLRGFIDGSESKTFVFKDAIYNVIGDEVTTYSAEDTGLIYDSRDKTVQYSETTIYQELLFSQASLKFSHDEAALRASNPVNINFMGSDRGEVTCL